MPKKFQKFVENFTCDNCGQQVIGSGYTNHCPACLWTKHVDINPGDRLANCGGLMQPIGLLIRRGKKIIVHHCLRCGHEKLNESTKTDSTEVLIKLSAQPFMFKSKVD